MQCEMWSREDTHRDEGEHGTVLQAVVFVLVRACLSAKQSLIYQFGANISRQCRRDNIDNS